MENVFVTMRKKHKRIKVSLCTPIWRANQTEIIMENIENEVAEVDITAEAEDEEDCIGTIGTCPKSCVTDAINSTTFPLRARIYC